VQPRQTTKTVKTARAQTFRYHPLKPGVNQMNDASAHS
jgi:hypothetical protein